MNSLASIAVLLCACAMANAGTLLPYGYGAYSGYYGLPFVPGVAPYAAPAVPAPVAAAAVPAARAIAAAAAVPAAPAVAAAPAVPAAVVPEYFSYPYGYPYGYPYLGAYGAYPYLKK
ncbi:hypothetical protein TNIN_399741 [Trichonephila inaurata madagascariensis]|uniref:Uncharacterized protein n=1 Tax=Trichonephila inaurata madagascariensis TaxID=2747483 RepID=A0A8X6XIS5_9ARAC|nr:hypothetical protein TNIN_399741 [Trichonephila inaurata madagascariensis]